MCIVPLNAPGQGLFPSFPASGFPPVKLGCSLQGFCEESVIYSIWHVINAPKMFIILAKKRACVCVVFTLSGTRKIREV